MPHYCRSPQAQELFWMGSKKFLTKGASYKPGNDDLKLHGELVTRGLDPRIHFLGKES
jgi:hypothetical protein